MIAKAFQSAQTLLAYLGSCRNQVESLELAGATAVQRRPGPPCVEADEVDGDRGDVVLEGGLGQAEVAGAADAGDVGDLGHQALDAGPDGVSAPPSGSGLLGGPLAWTGPLAYLFVGAFGLYTDWHPPTLSTPWIWPARPPHDVGGALCAAGVFVAGRALITLRGARESPGG